MEETIEKLTLNVGDILVVKCHNEISEKIADRMISQIGEILKLSGKENKILIIDKTVDLQVIEST